MASFPAVRDALKAALDTVTGLRGYDTAPGTIDPPAAIVAPSSGQFLTFNSTLNHGADDMRFSIFLLVSSGWSRSAQDQLDGFLAGSGATSVRAALEDVALSDLEIQYVAVSGVSGYGSISYAGAQYYGCQFQVNIGV